VPPWFGLQDYAHDDVELQLELVVEQHDDVEQEQVDVVLQAQLVLVDAAMSSAGVKSTTSKVSASRIAMWSFSGDIFTSFPRCGRTRGLLCRLPLQPMWLQLVVDVELVELQLVLLQLDELQPQQLEVEQLDHANPGSSSRSSALSTISNVSVSSVARASLSEPSIITPSLDRSSTPRASR
jgi:hypothetical protein